MTADTTRTGWPPGMLQDDDRELSKWLASKPGAIRQAAQVAEEISTQGHAVEPCGGLSDAASEAMRWIPVSERLPADRVSALAWDGVRIGTATCYAGEWGSVTHMKDITHWMPLPPPPASSEAARTPAAEGSAA